MGAKDLVAKVVSSAVCLNEFRHCSIRAKCFAFEGWLLFYGRIFSAFFALLFQLLRLVQQKATDPLMCPAFS